MSTRSKSKQEEALQFLDDLDNLNPTSPSAAEAPASSVRSPQPQVPPANGEAAEVLAFLDEITQKSSEPTRTTTSHIDRPISRAGTPTLRKSVERVRVGTPSAPLLPSTSSTSLASRADKEEARRLKTEDTQQASSPPSSSSWGWSNVWTSASAALQQAKSAVDEQVKNLPNHEQARKWSEAVTEYAKSAQLDKIGQDFKRRGLSTLTDILNVVAPPISEHEVIQVWLSHDMQGYDGIETLVYRALTRIMEQVEGGDLLVNRGEELKPREPVIGDRSRDLNAIEGYEAAFNFAQASLDALVKKTDKPKTKSSAIENPTVYSHIYLRLQPFLAPLSISSSTSEPSDAAALTKSNLQFILILADPSHALLQSTVTQAVPAEWVDLWDKYDWVEDLVAESLRVGVEVIGQQYVVSRMGWGKEETPQVPQVNEPRAEGQEEKSNA